MSLSVRAVVAMVVLAGAGCGEEAESAGGAGGAGAEGSGATTATGGQGGGGQGGGQGGGNQGGGNQGGGAGVGAPTHFATVSIANVRMEDQPAEGQFHGAFGQAPAATVEPDAIVGDCRYFASVADGGGEAPPALAALDVLTVNGTLIAVEPARRPDGTYYDETDATPLRPGLAIEVAGRGVDVPAFDLSLTAPARAVLVAPDLSEPLLVDRDAVFVWEVEGDGGEDGSEMAMALEPFLGAGTGRVVCNAPSEQGEIVVPAAFLEHMVGTVYLHAGILRGVETRVDDWSFTFLLGDLSLQFVDIGARAAGVDVE